MRALPEGFDLIFTEPVDPVSAGSLESCTMKSYTYLYSSAYGSDEIDNQSLNITSAKVSADRLSVRLKVEGLRELYVHELHADGIRSARGTKLEHADAYYTLNRIPRK